MIRIGLILVLSFVFSLSSFSQNDEGRSNFGKDLYVGISGTYIYDSQNLYHKFHEFTFSTRVGMSFSKALVGGVQVLSIYIDGTHIDPEYFFVKGAYLQYDFLSKLKDRFYAELSYSYGDYCTCDGGDPYRVEGLSYIGLGVGGDLALGEKGFYVSGAFVTHYIVNDLEGKYNYNIYKIGLKYRISRR